MEFTFITQDNAYYKEAVALRIALFFKDMPNALELINDKREDKSIFLIALKDDILVGVGRLSIESEGIISQMAIKPSEQGNGVGRGIVDILLSTCKELKLPTIVLSARENAIGFYQNFGFLPEGDFYPSKKTGVIHQNMCLQLSKE